MAVTQPGGVQPRVDGMGSIIRLARRATRDGPRDPARLPGGRSRWAVPGLRRAVAGSSVGPGHRPLSQGTIGNVPQSGWCSSPKEIATGPLPFGFIVWSPMANPSASVYEARPKMILVPSGDHAGLNDS